MGSRLNWANRQSPGEFDVSAPEEASYEFDYRQQGGAAPWPLKHGNEKFGPSLIRKAWAAGLVVYAEVEGFPHPIAVKEASWTNNHVLVVKTLEGERTPSRLFTRTSVKGMDSSGLLIESEG